MFHVKVAMVVSHGDREIEFIDFKHKVTDHIRNIWESAKFDQSCEQIAENILDKFDAAFVEVSEDGENGAIVYSRAYLQSLREDV